MKSRKWNLVTNITITHSYTCFYSKLIKLNFQLDAADLATGTVWSNFDSWYIFADETAVYFHNFNMTVDVSCWVSAWNVNVVQTHQVQIDGWGTSSSYRWRPHFSMNRSLTINVWLTATRVWLHFALWKLCFPVPVSDTIFCFACWWMDAEEGKHP